MTPQASFEALMLICFGLAWPMANLRMRFCRNKDGQPRKGGRFQDYSTARL